MARPSKLTPTLAEQIAVCVREGIDPHVAAGSYGISRSSFYSWMAQGREGRAPFMEFLDAIERASAEAIVRRVGQIARAGQRGNWRASAWLLERMAPDLYAKPRRISVNVSEKVAPPLSLQEVYASLEFKVSQILKANQSGTSSGN